MLISLRIKDLILIETAELFFGSGLNILTGETGSGKSAILTAIRLIVGERADGEWIRTGAPCALVEAMISPFSSPLFEEIDLMGHTAPITIRREVHRSGKSRCFVEERLVSVGFLRSLLTPLIALIDQSSTHTLLTEEEQRKALDAFAGLTAGTAFFAISFAKEEKARRELDETLSLSLLKNRELAWAEECLKLIEETHWEEGEEERLHQEHNHLSHTQDLVGKMGEVLAGLSNGVPQIRRLSHVLEILMRQDSSLKATAEQLKAASLELEETERSLISYTDLLEANPSRLAFVEARMQKIEQLKRRFGSTWEAVEQKKQELSAQIERFSNLEEEIAEKQRALEHLEKQNLLAAETTSKKRCDYAQILGEKVLTELKELSLPHAQFHIACTKKELSAHGLDEISFLFSANQGHPSLPLNQCASGGELSRLLLALKSALAAEEHSRCLIFDEIDSNVGGQAAATLGEKLKQLACFRQVLCITHFVQVAKMAMDHFLVAKEERGGSSVTRVRRLEKGELEGEYHRMLGCTPTKGVF
ncbi:MAG: hypothetical protein HY861_02710 [Chlamydiia bacterium]|nr:hypothetical protein [Chlamydiia bacterium]